MDNVKISLAGLDNKIRQKAQKHLDTLIKPVGSLGYLETMVRQYAAAQQETKPELLSMPRLAIFAYGQEPAAGNHLLNTLALSAGSAVYNFSLDKRMPFEAAWQQGQALAKQAQAAGCQVVALVCKEPGLKIPNLASLPAYNLPQIAAQTDTLTLALAGCLLGLARARLLLILAGERLLAAGCVAAQLVPEVKDYFLPGQTQVSEHEAAYCHFLQFPVLLPLRLAAQEGYGTILLFTMLSAGVRAYREMGTFDSAGVESIIDEYTKGVCKK